MPRRYCPTYTDWKLVIRCACCTFAILGEAHACLGRQPNSFFCKSIDPPRPYTPPIHPLHQATKLSAHTSPPAQDP